ncbi:hypothetical protein D9C73_019091 [Collichthys lucidus]|uniref:Uncharacterized protein n=1 Tax=Collichthys lucidus TaxID=240159 RepID=A0A4V6ARE6_COLLU|nr:hypothetical protein D9C73_019091 [Collichthys lucidus]
MMERYLQHHSLKRRMTDQAAIFTDFGLPSFADKNQSEMELLTTAVVIFLLTTACAKPIVKHRYYDADISDDDWKHESPDRYDLLSWQPNESYSYEDSSSQSQESSEQQESLESHESSEQKESSESHESSESSESQSSEESSEEIKFTDQPTTVMTTTAMTTTTTGGVSDLTLGPAPVSTDGPNVTPPAATTTTPNITPDVTPNITPDVTPNATPNVTPDVTPNITPDVTPSVTSNNVTHCVTVEIPTAAPITERRGDN